MSSTGDLPVGEREGLEIMLREFLDDDDALSAVQCAAHNGGRSGNCLWARSGSVGTPTVPPRPTQHRNPQMIQTGEPRLFTRKQCEQLWEENDEVSTSIVATTGVCSICNGRYGERVRAHDPHLINMTTGVIHTYGNWSDVTGCGRDCTGPTWMHKL
jgi:hypothetical protein